MEPDDLYGLPLDRFVAERGALAKELRAERRRDEAKEVAGLRKPSVAAWAVNQLVRTQDAGVGELLAAGDALRSAQEDLLAGKGDARALRTAGERERAAVDALVEAARGLLTSGGLELSEPVVERVADTLHAAALDEDAREQVQEGAPERELRHVGLGLGLGEGATAAAPAAPGSSLRRQARRQAGGQGAQGRPQGHGARRARARRQARGARARCGPQGGPRRRGRRAAPRRARGPGARRCGGAAQARRRGAGRGRGRARHRPSRGRGGGR